MHKQGPEEALVTALEARIPEIAERTLALLRGEVAAYHALDAASAADVRAIIEGNLVVWCRTARLARQPDDVELSPFFEGARRRAREGVSLDGVLSAYRRGAAVAWEVLASVVDHDDPASLSAGLEVSGWIVRYIDQVSTGVAAAYTDERLRLVEGNGRLLAAALLSEGPTGATTRQQAQQLDVRLGSTWWVAVTGAAHADRLDDEGRARSWRVRLEKPDAVAVLRCAPPTPVDGICMGVAGPTDGPQQQACDQAAAAWHLAESAGRTGVVRLDDVLFDAITGVMLPVAALRIAELGRQMVAHDRAHRTGMIDTLHALVEADGVSNRAARALHLHRNTLGYRLDRIAALTGHDPSGPRGLTVLLTAVRSVSDPR